MCAKDQATLDALAGALPTLMAESISQLQGRRLDSEFFNGLVAPDATGLMLRWLSDPEVFKQRRSDAEWKAFCQQCKTDFRFDPVKDGPLKAAELLAQRGNRWSKALAALCRGASEYIAGIVEWLKRAAPKQSLFDTAEVWPSINESEERSLQQALESLVDRPQDEVIRRVAELEAQHGGRRAYPWQKLGLSPLATALEPLAQLAELCKTTRGAPTPGAYAEFYASEGLARGCRRPRDHGGMRLAGAARCRAGNRAGSLSAMAREHRPPPATAHPATMDSRFPSAPSHIETAAGRLVLFADGLRMDVAQQLASKLAIGIEFTQDWEWSTIPSVTATAKPAASPIADAVQGGEASDEFSTRLVSTGQLLTQDRFVTA